MTNHAKHLAAVRIAAALGQPVQAPTLSDGERRVLQSVASGHVPETAHQYRVLNDLQSIGLVEKRVGVPHAVTDAGKKVLEVGR